jgi:hypothetical protein
MTRSNALADCTSGYLVLDHASDTSDHFDVLMRDRRCAAGIKEMRATTAYRRRRGCRRLRHHVG